MSFLPRLQYGVLLLITSVLLSGCLAVTEKLPGTETALMDHPLTGTWKLQGRLTDEGEVKLDDEEGILYFLNFHQSRRNADCMLMNRSEKRYTAKQMEAKYFDKSNGETKDPVLCVYPAQFQGKRYFAMSMDTLAGKGKTSSEGLPLYIVFRTDLSLGGKKMVMGTYKAEGLKDKLLDETKLVESDFEKTSDNRSVEIQSFKRDPEGFMRVLSVAELDEPEVFNKLVALPK